MKKLIIIGARSYGREIYNLATQCNEFEKEWVIKGFLDDKKSALDGLGYPVPVLAAVEDYKIEDGDVFICALGGIEAKKKYINIILEKGGEFVNIIHPTAIINRFLTLGKGIIICGLSSVSSECRIEDFVTLQAVVVIGHDCKIGKWSHLNSYSFCAGNVELEEEVTLHPRATILPGLKIGKGATVGAGSIVIKSVKPGTTVFGNPAKELKF